MAKSKQQKEEEAEKARKAKVDAANRKKIKDAAVEEAALADTPLSKEENKFIVNVAAKMNEGRAIMQPSSAEILKYSKLVKRKDVGQKA